ncbi:hypothetical protein ABID22_003241 [Pontibacter aydingkolensis]|uniref:Uncharacterized protein n=1 Tax=Pontibacter aydingkolensis TaxID=1911536 RepID=A0ABS7CSB9_9BACT|nr:hypothetical protein [Pontibacter aydingkolensis]MBW7466680.1 hypothetical protein [Pontibacter aydingkolensis]
MSIKDIFNKVKKELKVVQGEETKDKVYTNENTFADEATAKKEFERSKRKLFDVNSWTMLSGINSTFQLYDRRGQRSNAKIPEIGYYIEIVLPASTIENWVQVSDIQQAENMAEFTVHPSEKPKQLTEEEEEVQHFFIKEASSTFRVTRDGTKIIGYEIGKNEGINNQGEEAGNRAVLNTLVAEGGWALFQEMQWDKLTSYLVHLEEIKE